MKKFFSWVLHPVLWTILGIIGLALLIWMAGPLLAFADFHPLESVTARLVLFALILALWFGRRLFLALRNKAASHRFFAALHKAPEGTDPKTAASESEVKSRFDSALSILQDAQFGGKPSLAQKLMGKSRQYVYQLPWYMFIGAPGSGKTTALLNAGLQFPLAQKMGNDPVKGVGGTRNCDWWFTEDAVLIDTAGRYTTQDSDKSSDSKEWGEFLGLIKKFRPRQPVNGLLVTISVSDLLHPNSAERDMQAAAVRSRIQELRKTLNHNFPVYVLVTKADLLAGFSEYFGHLDKAGRDQVLGFTFDFEENQPGTFSPEKFRRESEKLGRNLAAKAFERLQEERDPRARVAIHGFPHQAAALMAPLQQFLNQAFSETKLELPTLLRGVYMVSGTQEGSPMDRVLSGLARSFGFQGRALPAAKSSGKAFFLNRLLKEVIFHEAPLAGTNLNWERKLNRLKWGGAGIALVTGALAIAGWTVSYFKNASYVAEVTKNAEELSTALSNSPPSLGDLPTTLKLLAAVRGIPSTSVVSIEDPPGNHRLGLFQGRKLDEASQQAYQRLLQSTVGPYLIQRIEAVLRKGAGNSELQYETLKTYLMLRLPERLKLEDVKAWVDLDAELNLGTALTKEQRDELVAHTGVLLSRNGLQSGLRFDDKLVQEVQAALNRTPFPQRVFNRVKIAAGQDKLPEFRITNAGGDSAALVFTRPSGLPLSNGVPGLYSYNGYYKSFNKLLEDSIKKLADEEVWVLGITNSDNAKKASNPVTRQSLADEVKRIYLQEYANVWTKFLGDIAIVKSNNLAQSISTTQLLSGSDSPLPRLIRAIVKEVTLSERPDVAALASDKATEAVAGAKKGLLDLLGKPGDGASAQNAPANQKLEAIVDDRFDGLRRLVKAPAPGQPAPIDQTTAMLGELFQHFQSADKAAKTGSPAPPGVAIDKVQGESARLPEPLKTMLNSMVSVGEKQVQSEKRSAAGQQMAAAVGDPCTKAISGRYPFSPGSKQDVLAQDFGALFGPGGTLDDFFQKNLAGQVDTSTKPWKFRAVADQTTGDNSAALAQFQNAAEIRSAFFAGGARTPGFKMEIRPMEMDASLSQVLLEVDGQLVKQIRGANTPQSITWPGTKGSNQVKLQVVGIEANAVPSTGLTFDGPWALFRLFDAGNIQRTGGPERFRADFTVDGRPVSFEVTSASVQNPYRLAELRSFRCPQKL
jgi:type VI secretion system protein ImpL